MEQRACRPGSSSRSGRPGGTRRASRSHRAFIPLAAFRSLGADRANLTLNTLRTGDALRPHGTRCPGGTGRTGNPSGALRAYITLGACRADRASRTGRPLGTHVPLRTLTARIALGAHIPADTLDTLDALRPCVAPGAIAASRPRVSGRSYRSCISSGSPCAGCTGKSLGADRAGFPSVALGTGTTGIALDSLRARRPLVALRPGRPTLTAGGMALILVAVARIALIHLKHFLSFFFQKRHLSCLFLQIIYALPGNLPHYVEICLKILP